MHIYTRPSTVDTRERPHHVQDVTYSKLEDLSVRYRRWYHHNLYASFTALSHAPGSCLLVAAHVVTAIRAAVDGTRDGVATFKERLRSTSLFHRQLRISRSDLNAGALKRPGFGFKLSTSHDHHALFQQAASRALSTSHILRPASSWRSSAQITSKAAPVCVCLLRAGQSNIRSMCTSNWVGFCRNVSCGSSNPGLRSSGRPAQLAWSNTVISLAEAGVILLVLLSRLTVASTDINGV